MRWRECSQRFQNFSEQNLKPQEVQLATGLHLPPRRDSSALNDWQPGSIPSICLSMLDRLIDKPKRHQQQRARQTCSFYRTASKAYCVIVRIH